MSWVEEEVADSILHAQPIKAPDNTTIKWSHRKKQRQPKGTITHPKTFPLRDQAHIRVAQENGMNRKLCGACGVESTYQNYHIHHIDGDPNNNEPQNLTVLCPDCYINITHGYALPAVSSYMSGVRLEMEGVVDDF